MSEEHAAISGSATSGADLAYVLDWRALANQRLSRLVQVEHDCTVMQGRLERLAHQHDALLLVNDSRLERLHALQTSLQCQNHTVIELAARCAFMEASRSWRITAPLRNFSTLVRRVKPAIFAVLRWPIRRMRLGPVFLRISPVLHARVRSRLYP
ncbi:hypothetical protein [Rhodanobacter sp. BL-MT-08]